MSVKHIIPSFKAFYKAPCEKEMHQIIHGEDNYNYFEDGDDLFVQCGKQTQCLDRHHPYDRYSVSQTPFLSKITNLKTALCYLI